MLYEASHRLLVCLDDLHAILGDRQMAAARELTKLHEEWTRWTISAVRASFSGDAAPHGEFTLVVAGATPDTDEAEPLSPVERNVALRSQLRELLAGGM